MTRIIGVSGKSCSGKNYFVELLNKETEWPAVDVDVIGHDVIDQAASEVASVFGNEVILPDGKVNRKAVGRIVFSDSRKLEKLERIVHPRMVKKVRSVAENCRSSVLIVNAAILHRMRLDRICDLIVYVKAPFKTRLFRAMKRDGCTKDAFLKRCRSQRDISSRNFCKGKQVVVVDSGGSIHQIHRQMKRICGIICTE